jgi:hypothetical protein
MKTENLSKTREFFFHQNGINEKRSIVDEERKLKLSSMFLYPKFAFFAIPTYLLPKCDFKTIFKNSLSFLRQPLITNYNVNQCINESFGAFGLRRCYFYIVKRVKTRTPQVGL